jgi:hypothetical protein
MVHIFADSYFLHPLGGLGYQFFSGIGSTISEWLTILLAISVYIYHHNCHEHHCLRLSWHPDAEGHPVCKRHHEDHPSRGWFRSDKTHARHTVAKRRGIKRYAPPYPL